MKRKHRSGGVYLVVGCWLGLTATASAGPYVNLMQPCDCPPNHYTAMHVLTPAFWRWAAWCQGPCRYTFARVLHPDIATTYYVKKYHCPSVNPLQFAIQNYPGINGTLPQSNYRPSAEVSQGRRQPTMMDLTQQMLEKMRERPLPEKSGAPEKLPLPTPESEKK